MELEIQRLKLGLSAAQRDRALISIGRDPASIDPNRLLNPSYLFQVRRYPLLYAFESEHIALNYT